MLSPPFESAFDPFILAGGRSSRFGRDKALALLQGRPLIERAVASLASLGLTATIVAPRADPYLRFARRFLTDEQPGLGPVEGLRVALEACRCERALVLTVDMPWVDASLLSFLAAAVRPRDRAVCFADSTGRRHPFPGLYHRGLAPMLRRDGEELLGSMQEVLDCAGVHLLSAGDVPEIESLDQALRNVNSPEDLA